MTHRLALLAVAFFAAFAGACTSEPPLQVCTDELRVRFTPLDTTVVAGQGFTASVYLATCGGSLALTDAFKWSSQDPSVATVDSSSGQVIGQSTGETRVTAVGKRFGRVGGLRVVVQPPGR